MAGMKIALNIIGALLVLFGAIWFLQGINVLPGSFHDRADSVGGLRRDRDRSGSLRVAGCKPATERDSLESVSSALGVSSRLCD